MLRAPVERCGVPSSSRVMAASIASRSVVFSEVMISAFAVIMLSDSVFESE